MARIKVLLVCLGIVLISAPAAFPRVAYERVRYFIETEWQPITTEQLVTDSKLIVIGEVEDIREGSDLAAELFDEPPSWIEEVVILVHERIKGWSPDRIIVLNYNQEIVVWENPPLPRYSPSGRQMLIFFPFGDPRSGYYFCGPYAYTIWQGKILGSDTDLEQFVGQVRDFLAGRRSSITLALPAIYGYPAYMIPEDAVLWADLIVIGTVRGIVGKVPSSGEKKVVISVLERIKGESPDTIILVPHERSIHGAVLPEFPLGQEMLLLLYQEGGYYRYWLYLGNGGRFYAGAYAIEAGRISGFTLAIEEFVQQIEELLSGVRSEFTLEVPSLEPPGLQGPLSVPHTTWGEIKAKFK